ncbi:acyltransferase [Sphingomonas sp. F9_3S_D5_B_2]
MNSRIRLYWYQLLYRDLSIETGVTLGRGATVKVVKGGSLKIGASTAIQSNCEIVAEGRLNIGPRAFIGSGCNIVAADSITIGSDALIAEGVTIRDQDHRIDGLGVFNQQGMVCSAVRIGANVWIGAKATVLRGSTIGDNCVVAAHALVKGRVESGTVVGGIPARLIGRVGPAESLT